MAKAQIRGTFSVEFEVVYDPESGEIKILGATPSRLVPAADDEGPNKLLLSSTMLNFGILLLGKRRAEQLCLPPAGSPITVLLDEERFSCKLHASVPGRVDGLTKAYRRHYAPALLRREEITIAPQYDPIRNELRLNATATPKNETD